MKCLQGDSVNQSLICQWLSWYRKKRISFFTKSRQQDPCFSILSCQLLECLSFLFFSILSFSLSFPYLFLTFCYLLFSLLLTLFLFSCFLKFYSLWFCRKFLHGSLSYFEFFPFANCGNSVSFLSLI